MSENFESYYVVLIRLLTLAISFLTPLISAVVAKPKMLGILAKFRLSCYHNLFILSSPVVSIS